MAIDKTELKKVQSKLEEWEKTNESEFKKERKKEFTSDSGIPYKRVYTPLDLKDKNFDYLTSLGFPGEYPYTRGITPSMYRKEYWLTAQYIGFSTPEETNKLFKYLQARGANALHLAFDLPTIQGYDCDHPLALDDVGKTGISLSTVEDLAAILDGVDLSKLSVAWVNNPLSVLWVAMMVAIGERQGLQPKDVMGFFQNDIIKGFLTDSQFIFPPEPSVRLATDVIEYGIKYMPKARVTNLCCLQYEESGCDEAQQLAFGMATGIAYIRSVLKRGFDIDEVAPKIAFLGCVNHRDFLCEVAKWRAFRRLWAKIMKEEFGAKKPESMAPWVRATNGGLDLIKDARDMNVARGALGCLAMAFAGIQSATPKTYDEPLGVPSKESSLVAVQSSQLVHFETGVCDVIDPLGGSYCVEALTYEIEERAKQYLDKIEAMGGMVEAVKNGYAAQEILSAGYRHEERIQSGEKLLLGVNIFPPEEFKERDDFYWPAPAAVIEERIKNLREYRKKRDQKKVREALDKVKKVAEAKECSENNLIFPLLEAVRVGVTTGEVGEALREVYGQYRPAWL
jgi:methylmalonyl-CoA mutase N-terminal domain/subunit